MWFRTWKRQLQMAPMNPDSCLKASLASRIILLPPAWFIRLLRLEGAKRRVLGARIGVNRSFTSLYNGTLVNDIKAEDAMAIFGPRGPFSVAAMPSLFDDRSWQAMLATSAQERLIGTGNIIQKAYSAPRRARFSAAISTGDVDHGKLSARDSCQPPTPAFGSAKNADASSERYRSRGRNGTVDEGCGPYYKNESQILTNCHDQRLHYGIPEKIRSNKGPGWQYAGRQISNKPKLSLNKSNSEGKGDMIRIPLKQTSVFGDLLNRRAPIEGPLRE
ncbi:hypothetical protein RF11_01882 [Thelohanellus kitauei]|uniref:Uncharacterized protein n=1 Tax=Thelohanellus kitauei TaxID=669202 RepID=A0A0C2MUL1_THEKT|nr:hypothetical protein RF11_01882 [Thelohanellus kitauei]